MAACPTRSCRTFKPRKQVRDGVCPGARRRVARDQTTASVFFFFLFGLLTFVPSVAVVSVLDDDSEASAPGPETKEDVVALLDKAVTFNETALLEAEQKSMEAFAYEDSCLRKITQRRWLYAMLRKNCTATRMSASFEAMRVFAALPQPVSRILPRFDNATQKFQIRSLSAALFRQSRREITLLEELKASRCRASPGCELAFDEVRKAREKDVATVRDRAAWSTVSHCIGKLRQKRACFKTWLEAFEALPTHTVDSVRTFVNDFTQAGRRKESAAIMQAVSAKVNATRIAFVQCGFSRECRRKAKNTIMVCASECCHCKSHPLPKA